MQLWTVCFITLFVATQVYQLVKAVSLPMPVYIVAGALLAIASNVRRSQPSTQTPSTATPTPPTANSSPTPPNPTEQAKQTASNSNPFLSQTAPLPSTPIPPFPVDSTQADSNYRATSS